MDNFIKTVDNSKKTVENYTFITKILQKTSKIKVFLLKFKTYCRQKRNKIFIFLKCMLVNDVKQINILFS